MKINNCIDFISYFLLLYHLFVFARHLNCMNKYTVELKEFDVFANVKHNICYELEKRHVRALIVVSMSNELYSVVDIAKITSLRTKKKDKKVNENKTMCHWDEDTDKHIVLHRLKGDNWWNRKMLLSRVKTLKSTAVLIYLQRG